MIEKPQKLPKVNSRFFIFAVATLITVSACAPRADSVSSMPSHVEELSKHYEQHHDYQSLVMLIPYLQSNMTRSDVELLLGMPNYCPSPGQCYYASDVHSRLTCPYNVDTWIDTKCVSPTGMEVSVDGPPITLVVAYKLVDAGSSTVLASDRDLLWSYQLMPIGE